VNLLACIFATDSMCLSVFEFVQWAPKDVHLFCISVYQPFKIIQGQ